MKTTTRVLMATAVACSSGAFAQQPEPEAASQVLEEVVVTAEKREETAQKTPISMTVYSGGDLAAAGIHNIAAIASVDPSLNVTTSTGSAYAAVRGVASTDLTEIGDPAVAVSRDGFFTNRGYGLFSSLYDVARVEVLKGPQGTLFGRNSTGGVVNIITQRPTHEFGGFTALEVGSEDAYSAEGALNLPLGEKVQTRFSGTYRQRDGYRNNAPARERGDDEDARSGRAQIMFQPFEGFNGLLSVQRDHIGGVGDVEAKGPEGVPDTIPDSDTFPVLTPVRTDLTETRYRWDFTYSGLPGGVSLTYLGGHDKTSWEHALDATVFNTTELRQFLQEENPVTDNHEFRIAGDTGTFFWQTGVFYFKEHNAPLDSGLFIESGPFANNYLIHFTYDVHTTSKAAFGQVAWKPNDQWRFSAGTRYTKDEKERTGDAVLNLQIASGGFLPPILVTTPGNGNIENSKMTWHGGVDWTPTDTTLLYAKYDSGFKSGGFNSNGSAPSVPYGPEDIDAVEIGTKNRFMGNRLQFNAALFHQHYTGYQASQFTPALGGGPGVQNAGSAKIRGLEAEVVALSDALGRLSFAATWLDAEFTQFDAINSTGTAQISLAGNRLPNAPRFTATAALERGWPLGSGTLTAHIDGKSQSKFYYSFFNFADTAQKSYATGNFWVGYSPSGDRWNVQAFVRNFTDEAVLSRATRNDNAVANSYQFMPPRNYGVRVLISW
jgi:iron complex outermembrane receptor protein